MFYIPVLATFPRSANTFYVKSTLKPLGRLQWGKDIWHLFSGNHIGPKSPKMLYRWGKEIKKGEKSDKWLALKRQACLISDGTSAALDWQFKHYTHRRLPCKREGVGGIDSQPVPYIYASADTTSHDVISICVLFTRASFITTTLLSDFYGVAFFNRYSLLVKKGNDSFLSSK